MERNETKLTELMLYIGAKCGLDEHYGEVKLNKILFFADFTAYRTLGRPITGCEYRKYEQGPCPTGIKLLSRELQLRHEAFEYQNTLPNGMTEKRLLPMRPPDIDVFSSQEISIIDDAIASLRQKTGNEASDLSHEFIGWGLASLRDPIPYFTVFASPPESVVLTEDEAAWVESEMKLLSAAA